MITCYNWYLLTIKLIIATILLGAGQNFALAQNRPTTTKPAPNTRTAPTKPAVAPTTNKPGLPPASPVNKIESPANRIAIDGGKTGTNNPKGMVSVTFFIRDSQGKLPKQLMISNDPEFTGANWENYPINNTKAWILAEGEGEKTIYVKFKAVGDVESEVFTAKIFKDTEPPLEPTLTIKDGADFTIEPIVDVKVSAKNAKEMQVSASPNFANLGNKWQPYDEKPFKFPLSPPVDGLKSVFVRFRDDAGNISAVAKDDITLDRQPPRNLAVIADNGAKYTKSPDKKVTLQLKSIDPVASITIIKNGKPENMPFTPEIEYQLDGEDGPKKIGVLFHDEAGNKAPAFTEIILDRKGPIQPKIMINGGKMPVTNNKQRMVMLHLAASGDIVTEMIIANSDSFTDAKWERFNPMRQGWILSPEDGEKKVFVKFRDAAGNESPVASASIILDLNPPSDPKIELEMETDETGLAFTNDPKALTVLKLSATEADQMMISNLPTFAGAKWEPFNSSKSWQLENREGIQNVYAKFKDKANNETPPVTTRILLDRRPPQRPAVKINDGNSKYINTPEAKVTLNLIAEDAPTEMMVGMVADLKGVEWQPYKPQIADYELGAEDGIKTVYAKFKDKCKNETPIVSAAVLVDRKPPQNCKIVINNDSGITKQPARLVKLKLTADGADMMAVFNGYAIGRTPFEKYSPDKIWTLPPGDGWHSVSVVFKDLASNLSEPVTDSIEYDITPPQKLSFSIDSGKGLSLNKEGLVTLNISAEDATHMMVSNNPTFTDGKWEPYAVTKKYKFEGPDGEKALFIKFKDRIDNVSQPLRATIIIDRLPPSNPSLKINNDAKVTNNANYLVGLAPMATGAHEMLIANKADLSGGVWEPFQPRKEWKLEEGPDGSRTVYVAYRDKVGNETKAVSASISVDLTPPSGGKIIINSDSTCIIRPDRKANLAITATGATFMRLSTSPNFTSEWVKYQPAIKGFDLGGIDGIKYVYAQFKDEIGNISADSVSDQITLDRQPPSAPTIIINDKSEYTNASDKKVNLTISAKNATKMMLSNSESFAGAKWQDYQTIIEGWVLDGEDGPKTVFVKFKDDCENVSSVASAKVFLKRKF